MLVTFSSVRSIEGRCDTDQSPLRRFAVELLVGRQGCVDAVLLDEGVHPFLERVREPVGVLHVVSKVVGKPYLLAIRRRQFSEQLDTVAMQTVQAERTPTSGATDLDLGLESVGGRLQHVRRPVEEAELGEPRHTISPPVAPWNTPRAAGA